MLTTHHAVLILGLLIAQSATAEPEPSSAPTTERAASEPVSQPSTSSTTPAEALEWYRRIAVHGYVDLYYSFNFNQPADKNNFIPGTGTSTKRHNDFGLNLVALDVALNPEPFGFRLALNWGTGTEILHAGEPLGTGVGPEVWKMIQQATIAVKIPVGRGLIITGGIMPAFIGAEYLATKDNWNYTRNYMGELSPYYLTGIALQYAFDDHWSAQLLGLTGWQIIGDNNDAKSIGTQLVYNSDMFTLTFNGFAGPELAKNNQDWRVFADVVATLRPTAWLSLQLAGDFGYQQMPAPASDARWYAGTLYVRVQPLDWFAIAGRGEVYRDEHGLMTGTPQTLAEGTLTLEFKPTRFLILKLEGRYDHSTAPVFNSKDTDATGAIIGKRDQVLLVLGAVAYF